MLSSVLKKAPEVRLELNSRARYRLRHPGTYDHDELEQFESKKNGSTIRIKTFLAKFEPKRALVLLACARLASDDSQPMLSPTRKTSPPAQTQAYIRY